MTPQTTEQHGPAGRHRRLRSGLATWSLAAATLGAVLTLTIVMVGPQSDTIDRRAYLDGYRTAKQSALQTRNTTTDALAVGRTCSDLAGRPVAQPWYDGCADAVTGKTSTY
ncbi:hypothetical protein GCM10010441_76620 [Kitasatospora paracochleata]|uniref:Uncharacterized protein n=1 Tax=Kitasatospora paracochleata TaxID=58354 RepID=A0ABT1J4I6_9ACTN|nr:hypothetical protein [Kitasatospora paracochleata]MCP2312288.1 hypothetical protein [Kitasatospora paracochleata]